MNSDENHVKETESGNQAREDSNPEVNHDVVWDGRDGDCHSEVMSSSAPFWHME